MTNEQENIFIKGHIDYKEEYRRYNLEDLDAAGRAKVWLEGRKHIAGITDEEEKRKIYADLKQQYLEYLQMIKDKRP